MANKVINNNIWIHWEKVSDNDIFDSRVQCLYCKSHPQLRHSIKCKNHTIVCKSTPIDVKNVFINELNETKAKKQTKNKFLSLNQTQQTSESITDYESDSSEDIILEPQISDADIDSSDQLKGFNNKLLPELSFSQKHIQFFQLYRNLMIRFSDNCVCDRNKQNKSSFNCLEVNYRKFLNEKNNSFSNNNNSFGSDTDYEENNCLNNSEVKPYENSGPDLDLFGNENQIIDLPKTKTSGTRNSIWNYWEQIPGEKRVQCLYCKNCPQLKHSIKCKNHTISCELTPIEVKNLFINQQKAYRFPIWDHWEKAYDNENRVHCLYCKKHPQLKHAVKCKNHTISCESTPLEVKNLLSREVNQNNFDFDADYEDNYASDDYSSHSFDDNNDYKQKKDNEIDLDLINHENPVKDLTNIITTGARNIIWNFWEQIPGDTRVHCLYCKKHPQLKHAVKCKSHTISCELTPIKVKNLLKEGVNQKLIWNFWEIVSDDDNRVRCLYCKSHTQLKHSIKCKNHTISCELTPIEVKNLFKQEINTNNFETDYEENYASIENSSHSFGDKNDDKQNKNSGIDLDLFEDENRIEGLPIIISGARNAIWNYWEQIPGENRVQCLYCKKRPQLKHTIKCKTHTISCKYTPIDVKKLFKQELNKKPNNKTKPNLYVCHINDCNFTFKRFSSYLNHKRLHKTGNYFTKKILDRKNCSKNLINNRNILIKRISAGSQPLVLHECVWPGCESKFKFKAYLKKHEEIHITTDSGFVCLFNNCNKKFTSKRNLTRHALLHNPNRKRSGKIRLKQKEILELINNENVRTEIDTERNIKVYRKNDDKTGESLVIGYGCNWNECKFVCALRKQVKEHKLAKHSTEKPFACAECDFRTARPSSLTTHRRVHNETRPYSCNWPECQSRFKTKYYLSMHTMSHTGERPHPCQWPGCDKRFSTNAKLNNHQMVHCGEKPFQCSWPGCDRWFAVKGNMKAHTKIHLK